ncbi:cold shock domain-containing protein CG9705-like [Artemia franciscana]|uniref:CSD domain-containing protein n=1 Tax=Artemia franciscana TaxID=6661 RepID=A0AA88HYQ2_ARTSF|nr:hypothetical protein QYM36_006904 [Artemia franciscana]
MASNLPLKNSFDEELIKTPGLGEKVVAQHQLSVSPSNFLIPSPLITRRTRTKSMSELALERPVEKGHVKRFCRVKGHGFIEPEDGGDEVFVHISDIEGEYVPLEGDAVSYRLVPVPPKNEKLQAVHVEITQFIPEKHHKWSCPVDEDQPHAHPEA